MRSVIKSTICLFIGFQLILPIHAQNWAWAQSSNNSGSGEGYGLDKDLNGNIYACGMFASATLAFGTNTLTSTGSFNVYVVKYDPLGNVLWARSSTGSGTIICAATCLKTDINGNVLVTGYYNSTIAFGSQTLTNISGYDAFLVKYDANGNVLWAKSGGGTQFDQSYAVTVDPSGNSYITGNTNSTLTAWGSASLITSGGGGFLIKYDPSGNVLWAGQGTSATYNRGNGLSCDGNSNIYMTGAFYGTLIYGTVTITSTGGQDSYLVKFDAFGNAIWAASGILCAGSDAGLSVSNDLLGNSYLAGQYSAPGFSIGAQSFTNAGSNDGYVVKFDQNGNPLWANVVTGPGQDYCYSCSAYQGGVYLCGGVTGGSCTIGNYNFPIPAAVDNMFIANYDSNGNLLFANTLPGGGDDESSIVAISACSAVISGDYAINAFTLGNTTLSRQAGSTEPIFAAKFNIIPAIYVPGKVVCGAQSVSITASGMSTYTWSNNSNSPILTVSPLVTTSYTVSGNRICGSGSAVVTITVNPSPTVNATVSSPSVCTGAQIVLNASGANSYTWTGGVVNGIPFVANTSTTYTVNGSNSFNCAGTATASILVVQFPTVAPIASPTAICLGNSATLTAQGANSYTWFPVMSNQPSIVVSPTVNSTYSITRANSNCITTRSISLFVNPVPSVTLVSNNTIICIGNSATITASGANAYTWPGFPYNNTAIVAPTLTTTYTVIGTNFSNGCTASNTIQIVVQKCTSVEKFKLDLEEIKIYPNPNLGELTVELKAHSSKTQFLLFDDNGRLVYKSACNPGQNKFDLTGLAKGIYYWEFIEGSEKYNSGKIINLLFN